VRVAAKNCRSAFNSRADGRAGDRDVDHGHRLVGVAACTDIFCRHARRLECDGVCVAVVANGIEFGCDHDRGRQPGQIGGPQRCEAGIASINDVDVVVVQPADKRCRQTVALRIVGERCACHVAVC